MSFSVDDGFYCRNALRDETTNTDHGPPFRNLRDLPDVGICCLQDAKVRDGEVVKYEDVDVDWNTLCGREEHDGEECDRRAGCPANLLPQWVRSSGAR